MTDSNAYSHQRYHLTLLDNFTQAIRQQAPFCGAEITADEQTFINQLDDLVQQVRDNNDGIFNGQQLLCKVIANYPHITPIIPRDLLWFFGGDCLHFMPDNEIHSYQQLDELRFAADEQQQAFHYEEERAKVFGLH